MTDHDYLISIHACSEAVEWLGDRTGAEAWALCERADWMLWLVARIASRQTLVRAACACARTVLHLIQPGDDQPRLAIEAWGFVFCW